MAWVGAVVIVGGMAGAALGWRSCKSAGVAFGAIGRKVRPCQREIGGVVVKNNSCVARGVAGQAGVVGINISIYPDVLVVGRGVGMAGCTGKCRIICRVGVAIYTSIPLAFVFAAVNGEIRGVVLAKHSGHPIWIGGVALGAVVGETRRYVVRGLGGFKIGLVAGKTSIGRARKSPARMAFFTVRNLVPLG